MELQAKSTNGDHEAEGGSKRQHAKVLTKWYRKRYELFYLFDEGIKLTEAGWYSVTPESIALKMAYHISQSCSEFKTTIIDVFAGAGGNSIAFAKFFNRHDRERFHVIAIEKDEAELETARNNAKIYNVDDYIEFILGDCFEVLKQPQFRSMNSIIFASPPWGGPTYKNQEIFNLDTMEPYNLWQMYDAFSKVTADIVFFLPRTSNLNQISSIPNQEQNVPVVDYAINGYIKGIGVFYGKFTNPAVLQNAPTSELVGLNSKQLCRSWFVRNHVPPF